MSVVDLTDDEIAWCGRLAAKVEQKVPRVATLDDLTQEALLAAYQAKLRYKPSRNSQFCGYAYRRVIGACFELVRRKRFTEATSATSGHHDERFIASGDMEDNLDRKRAIDRLHASVAALPPKSKAVTRMILAGKTNSQISAALKISLRTVSALRRQALKQITFSMRVKYGRG